MTLDPDFSNRALIETIYSLVTGIYSGSAGVRHTVTQPGSVDIDQSLRIAVTLTDGAGGSLSSANITEGTYNVKRTRGVTTTTIVSGATPSKGDGMVYVDYTVDDATWNVDDLVWFEFEGIEDTASGLTFPTIHAFIPVINLQAYQTTIQNTYDEVTDATYGLAALLNAIENIDVSSSLVTILTGRELLTNRTFDSDVTNWSLVAGDTLTYDGTIFHGAAGAAHVDKAASGVVQIRQTLGAIVEGQRLTMTYWVYSDVGGSCQYQLKIDSTVYGFFDDTGASVTVPAATWTRLTKTNYEVQKSGTLYFELVFTPASNPSNTYWDDCSCVLVDDPGAVLLAIDGIDTKLDIIDANVDTLLVDVATVDSNVDAIKAKTDNLPASPAATSDCLTQANVRTAIGLASANLDTQLSTIDTVVDGVLASTAPIKSSGLRAYWALTGTLRDLINDLTLTNSNATSTYGFEGRAYSFNGTTSKLTQSTTNLSGLSATGISLSAWVKPSTSHTGGIIWFGTGSGNRFGLYVISNVPRFIGNNGSAFLYDAASALSSNAWSHVVATYDGVSGATKIYINGVESGVGSTLATGGFTTTGSQFTIGALDTTIFWNGKISECAIWDGVLTSDEIIHLYRNRTHALFTFVADASRKVQTALHTAIGSANAPTAATLMDILHKDGSYTFSKTTDSLEAIADAIAAISTGSLAVTEARKSNNMSSVNPVTMSKDVGSGKLMEIMDIKFIHLVQSSDEDYTISVDLEDDRNSASSGTLGSYSVGAAASSATNKVNENLSLNSTLTSNTGFPTLRFPLYSRTIDITVNQIGGTEGTIIILLYYRTINSYTSENL